MTTKYVRLPNGNKKEVYSYVVTNACILNFLNTEVNDAKDFVGTDIIDYIDIIDENDKILQTYDIYAKRKSVILENTKINVQEQRVVSEEWTEEVEISNNTNIEEVSTEEQADNSETEIQNNHQTIVHPEVVETITKEVPVEMTTVILEKPSVNEEIDAIKNTVGIVNTNNMSLDEFKDYYKGLLGMKCTDAIFLGSNITTSLGEKHFSYTLEDQSNIKDLYNVALATEFASDIPYHADGELCKVYKGSDVLSIYLTLSNNKIYHTTYCNFLNSVVDEAKDMDSIKAIYYGMELPEEYKNGIDAILQTGKNAVDNMLKKYGLDSTEKVVE